MATHHQRKMNVGVIIPFLVIALAFGLSLWKKYDNSRDIPTVPPVQQPAASRTVVLFFGGDEGKLVREARDLDSCIPVEDCLRETLVALFSGPVGDYEMVTPERAAINSVRLDGTTAVIDVNRFFAEDLLPGSSSEISAVYAVVNTICANFSQITQVKLNIEGNQQAVLGHLELSDPLAPDYSLEAVEKPKLMPPNVSAPAVVPIR